MDSLSTGIGTIVCFTRMTNLSEENLTSMALRVSGVLPNDEWRNSMASLNTPLCYIKESEFEMESQERKHLSRSISALEEKSALN